MDVSGTDTPVLTEDEHPNHGLRFGLQSLSKTNAVTMGLDDVCEKWDGMYWWHGNANCAIRRHWRTDCIFSSRRPLAI
jgi:hypothetical protein